MELMSVSEISTDGQTSEVLEAKICVKEKRAIGKFF